LWSGFIVLEIVTLLARRKILGIFFDGVPRCSVPNLFPKQGRAVPEIRTRLDLSRDLGKADARDRFFDLIGTARKRATEAQPKGIRSLVRAAGAGARKG
jgi:hypothetical protein